MRKYATLIIALSLIELVATACIVRTRQRRSHGQPVYVEKHKQGKHKHKKHKHKHKKHR